MSGVPRVSSKATSTNQQQQQKQQKKEAFTKDNFKAYLEETGLTLVLQHALAGLYNDCVKSGEMNEDPLGFIANFLINESSSKSVPTSIEQSNQIQSQQQQQQHPSKRLCNKNQ